MKDLTVVSGKMFVTSMQKPSYQRENFLLEQAEPKEVVLWRSEQRERPALRWVYFSIVKAVLIIFGVQTVP